MLCTLHSQLLCAVSRPHLINNMDGKSDAEGCRMTFKEKIEMIDHEIRLLHKFCKETGYSPHKINDFAQPFLQEKRKSSKKGVGCMCCFAVVIGVCSILMYMATMYPVGQAIVRLTITKFLPLYKWIQVEKDTCLIKNPLFVDQYLTEDDCKLCSEIREITKVKDLSEQSFMDQYMKNGQHIIVQDGMKDWPESTKSLDVEGIKRAFQDNTYLRSSELCDVQCNLPYSNVKQFFNKVERIKQGYFMAWTNCDKQAAKATRRFYRRPYFLPSSVEMFEQNHIYFSKHFKDKEIIEYKAETAMMILYQIKGSSEIILTPEDMCNKMCHPVKDILKEGELLVTLNTNAIWSLAIQGLDEEENVVIAVEGNYN